MNPQLIAMLMKLFGQQGQGQLRTPPFVPGTGGPMSPMPGAPRGLPGLGTPGTFPGAGGPPQQPQQQGGGFMDILGKVLQASLPIAGQVISNKRGAYVGKGYSDAAAQQYERSVQQGQIDRQKRQDEQEKIQKQIENRREQQRVDQEKQRLENERLQREAQIGRDKETVASREVDDARQALAFLDPRFDITGPEFAELRKKAKLDGMPLTKVKEQLYVIKRNTGEPIAYHEGWDVDRSKFTQPMPEKMANQAQESVMAQVKSGLDAPKETGSPQTTPNVYVNGELSYSRAGKSGMEIIDPQENIWRAVRPSDKVIPVAQQNTAVRIEQSIPQQSERRADALAAQFDNEQIVKDYNTISQNVEFIKSVGGSPTDDQARIYAFAKTMDPGSVVREGEYKTVQDYSLALFEKFGFRAKRIFDNAGFLTQEARNFMEATLEKRLEISSKSYKNTYEEYGRRIDAITGKKGEGRNRLTDYSKTFSGGTTAGTIMRDTSKSGKPMISRDGGKTWEYE